MLIEYIIVIDTEFVSSKDGQQPFQIAMRSYRLVENRLMNISNFNAFVQLREGLKLTYFAKKYSGITQEKLEELGIYPTEAINQVINFLLNFDLTKTVLVGWDPVNDKRMLDALLNYGDHLINLDSFQWFDLATPYRQLYKPGKKDTPSLKEACESLMLGTYDFHDAEVDVLATSALLEALLEKHGSKSILLDYLHPKKRIKYIKKRVNEDK
jgi:inhibitor of KinA sporulation pathway (predicted exonuclease)